MNTKHYYHYATKGLEDDYLFGSITAFVAAMNRIAICFSKVCETSSIIIIGFSLMDNHVHFILYGNEDDCDSFMALYKRLTEIWLTNHPEEGRPGKEWDIGHWQIKDKDSLLEKLSYVHRNPVVAFLPYTATGYRWSSACLPFADHSYVQSTARPLGTLNRTAQRKLLESKVVLPSLGSAQKRLFFGPRNRYRFLSTVVPPAESTVIALSLRMRPSRISLASLFTSSR